MIKKIILLVCLVNVSFGSEKMFEEYGVCIFVDGEVFEKSLDIRDSYAKKYPSVPKITPHITLIQGAFNDPEKLDELLKTYAKTRQAFDVVMDLKLAFGGGGNTFWDVDKNSTSWQDIQIINQELCKIIPHPVEPLSHTKESIQNGTANLDLIKKYGRDFNVPENNRPHITVVYGVQDQTLMDSYPIGKKHSFKAKEICLVKIDKNGNIKEKLENHCHKLS
jgi:2'-5' RNA ligase